MKKLEQDTDENRGGGSGDAAAWELVLAGALAGGSQILISGDEDLLTVAEQSPIPILSPRAFMTLARG